MKHLEEYNQENLSHPSHFFESNQVYPNTGNSMEIGSTSEAVQTKQGSCSRQSRRLHYEFREFINNEFTVPSGCRRVRITFTSKWTAYDHGIPCCQSGPDRVPFFMDGNRRMVEVGSNVCGDRSGEEEAPGSYITRSLTFNLSPGNHRWRMETGIPNNNEGCIIKLHLNPMLIEIY